MRSLYFLALLPIVVGGCVLEPKEAKLEKDRVSAAGKMYEQARANRTAPVLPAKPDAMDVLRFALLNSAEIEASYHEWAMAVAKIDQAGSFPTQNLNIGAEYMFSGERMKAFDRTTVTAGLMDASDLPNKSYQNAKVAWREAMAAGERFRDAKFALQAKVLQAWADYCLQAERVRIQAENVSLLKLFSQTAAARVRTGGAQQDQLRADVQLKLAENELATMQSEMKQKRASINAILIRPSNAELVAPATLPLPRVLNLDDESLLAVGVAGNAELAAIAHDEQARVDAIERARMEYLPGINPMAAFTGSLTQSIGATISIPTQIPRIQAMVSEARSDLKRIEAMSTQTRANKSATYLASLVALRDAERRATLFEQDILPLAKRVLDVTKQGYSSGNSTFLDVIDAQRTLLDVRLLAAEARTIRENMLAELEMLAGVDFETLGKSPTTQPQDK